MIDKDNPKREHGLYSPAAKPAQGIWSDEFWSDELQKHKEKLELDRSIDFPFMRSVFSIIDTLYEIKDEDEFKKQKNVANPYEFKLIQQQKRTDRYKRLFGTWTTDLYRTQDDLDEIELEKQKNAAYLKLAFDRNPELKKKHNFWSNCKLLSAVWFVTLLVAVSFPFPDVLINFAAWTGIPTLAIGVFSICKEVYVNEKAHETLSESDKEKVRNRYD